MASSAPVFAPTPTEPFALVEHRLALARAAQRSWALVSLQDRLSTVRRFRHRVAANALELAALLSPDLPRSQADTLAAELLPLAEAAKFLEREAPRLLARHKLSSRSRPLWLPGLELHVHYDPWGTVLVIGPSNYPIFLPCVQALQALAAGNAVVWKPGLGAAPVARALADLLTDAGLPPDLLCVTDESPEIAQQLIRSGVDKIVMTGSETSGRAVLRTAAEHLTPATVELSGCDAMFVLESADVERAVDALLFGLRLNGSGTCIAPRRIFVQSRVASALQKQLEKKLSSVPSIPITSRTARLVQDLINDAIAAGATLLTHNAVPDLSSERGMSPVTLLHARPEMQVMRTDVFAPIISLCVFEQEAEALALSSHCPYALGATVFGSTVSATRFAAQLTTGIVVVNDMIAPTADPRISFGGRGASGFGKSRGVEGLLEMTCSKTIAVQTSRRLRHLEPPHPKALQLFSGFIKIMHGAGFAGRARLLLALGKSVAAKSEFRNQ